MAFQTFVLIILLLIFTGSLAEHDSITPFQPIRDGTTLVSKEGSFELGFFSPGSSGNRYLGIWYKNITVRTVVWVANRCNPINDSYGLLTINRTGNLVILNQNKSVIWSTRLSKQAKKPKVVLLDSGNLVVMEEEDTNQENYLWQSFDYPSDTLLPGMKFGWDLRTGLNRRLSAWKNWDDPCSTDFTWEIVFDKKLHKVPEMVLRKGTSEIYRSGPWNGLSYSGTPALRPNPLFNFVLTNNDDEVCYSYSLKNKSVISRIFINETTRTVNRFTWIKSERRWSPYSSLPRDYCDKYGLCGANGHCIISNSPNCQCLKGFKPKSQEQWSSMDWSQGCIRNIPLRCQDKHQDGFLKLSSLKLPDTTHSWVNKDMNLKECRAKCLSNCSCMAYSNLDIREHGTGCIIWFGDLMNIRQVSEGIGGQDINIRMPGSKLDNHKGKKAILIVGAALGSVSGMLFFGYCIYRKRDQKERNKTLTNRAQEEDLELPLLNLSTICIATDYFSEKNKLGEGGFGPVYRGKLQDGQEIAVKRLSMNSKQGINEFKNEVKLIAKLQHRNLVKLLGCCIKGRENLLVYEYMPNKSLDYVIFDPLQGRQVEWSKCFQIICGIARGLLYLHHDSRLRIVHRDLKASNILLDNEMNPKISDFGLARIFEGDQIENKTNRVIGTYGYMAPEYVFNGVFSVKSDVFSFGILVLEIVSRKKNRSFHYESHDLTLIGHAWTLLKEDRPFELLDESLIPSYDNLNEVLRCIHIGLLCVQQSPTDRPCMSSVVLMLGSQIELPKPKPPGFFMEIDSEKGDHSSSKLELFSKNNMSMTIFEGRL